MALRPGKNYPGTTMRITGNFGESEDCDPIDPDISVTFKLMSPSGIESSYIYLDGTEIQKLAVGAYSCDIIPNEPGRWFYQWVVSDLEAGTVVDEGNFLVQATPFYQGGSPRYY